MCTEERERFGTEERIGSCNSLGGTRSGQGHSGCKDVRCGRHCRAKEAGLSGFLILGMTKRNDPDSIMGWEDVPQMMCHRFGVFRIKELYSSHWVNSTVPAFSSFLGSKERWKWRLLLLQNELQQVLNLQKPQHGRCWTSRCKMISLSSKQEDRREPKTASMLHWGVANFRACWSIVMISPNESELPA